MQAPRAGNMKLLVDMNLSPLWVPFLIENGFIAAHWSEVGTASAPDAEIMNYAEANNFVILTHDLDFGALLAARKTRGPSVIQVRAQNILPDDIGAIVIQALNIAQTDLANGALVTVDPTRHRIRLLPF